MTVRQYLGNKLKTKFYYRHPWSYARRAVYSIDEPSATIRGVNRPIPKGYPGHHLDATRDMSLVRALTSAERSYIQTFPEHFVWLGGKGNTEQLIGNAVPVKLGEYVAKALQEYIAQKTPLTSSSTQEQAKIDFFGMPYANDKEYQQNAA